MYIILLTASLAGLTLRSQEEMGRVMGVMPVKSFLLSGHKMHISEGGGRFVWSLTLQEVLSVQLC